MTGGRIVVIGKTGSNFAAGMEWRHWPMFSTKQGNFDYFCNMGMVELSLVEDMSGIAELDGPIDRSLSFYKQQKGKKMIIDDPDKYNSNVHQSVPIRL